MVASYRPKTRTITIYREHSTNVFDLQGAAFHELAHHLLRSNRNVCERPANAAEGAASHGKAFIDQLDGVLRDFAFRYREHLKGIFVFDAKRPRLTPKFVYFKDLRGRISVRQRLLRPPAGKDSH